MLHSALPGQVAVAFVADGSEWSEFHFDELFQHPRAHIEAIAGTMAQPKRRQNQPLSSSEELREELVVVFFLVFM